ncbi:hypothetical protein F4677DRAFT_449522 [Hypoxylon crocopeplum]|nr:hypothetical protein F4677DRAFT_449522 [Hypoxylon crocopeplum]
MLTTIIMPPVNRVIYRVPPPSPAIYFAPITARDAPGPPSRPPPRPPTRPRPNGTMMPIILQPATIFRPITILHPVTPVIPVTPLVPAMLFPPAPNAMFLQRIA